MGRRLFSDETLQQQRPVRNGAPLSELTLSMGRPPKAPTHESLLRLIRVTHQEISAILVLDEPLRRVLAFSEQEPRHPSQPRRLI
jgi:hypothetical protein